MPTALGRRRILPQDVKIAVVRTNFEKGIMRTISLVENFLDQVLVPAKSETNRPFFRLPTGIAIHLNLLILRPAHSNTPQAARRS